MYRLITMKGQYVKFLRVTRRELIIKGIRDGGGENKVRILMKNVKGLLSIGKY